MRIAKVLINLSLDKSYDYLVPDLLKKQIKTGSKVRVPFGKQVREGYVVGFSDSTDYDEDKLKPIITVFSSRPSLPDNLIKLADWISHYYCCTKGQAVKALLPAAVRGHKITHKKIKMYAISDIVEAHKFIFENEKRSPAKAKIIKLLLRRHELPAETILKETGVSQTVLRDLVRSQKCVVCEEKEYYRDPFKDIEIVPSFPHNLTAEQNYALKKIEKMLDSDLSRNRHTILLYGVTGSGKTEVYLQAIGKTLSLNKECIVLVPEISLTPQTVERFRARFGDKVSVLHSRLSEGERFDEWTKINEGKVKIVVGARSALFAPFKNLGLIIVDEEHETSYKQEEAPRYNARDVAVMRGKMENAVVILGSATPSLESYYNAEQGKYELAVLSRRIDEVKMPVVRIVDLSLEREREGMPVIFSKQLVEAIRIRIQNGEQVILFLNRRGFGRIMQCPECGYIAVCPECENVYTYHKDREALICHLCGEFLRAHLLCPECGSREIRYNKPGTEKIEILAAKLFPIAKIKRMDSDTMVTKNSYEETLQSFKSGKIDILIGTQMIAKGLHFPNVTLVGVLLADVSLFISDFRASERTFQLITQVAGRAGRGDIEGEVIIQTYFPFNPAIQYAVEHDYIGFYKNEMEARIKLEYPPVTDMIAIHFQGENESELSQYALSFINACRRLEEGDITISEPLPAPISKIKNKYRYMSIVKGKRLGKIRKYLKYLLTTRKKKKKIHVYVDVDPLNPL